MGEILRAESISKSFLLAGKPQLILENASFSLEAGQFASIIGPSGCGKSTFLEVLAGITIPESGVIWFAGKQITGTSGLLGYMPQDDLLFPWLNVVENALLPVRIKRGKLKEARERIAELLPVFGLQNHAQHLPYQLSGGLRQRTAFLRTCMTGSTLFLLDEPFAGLDAITRSQLQDWLKDIIIELKLSMILVTHDIYEAIHLSDVIHVMRSRPGSFIERFNVNAEQRRVSRTDNGLYDRILALVRSGVSGL